MKASALPLKAIFKSSWKGEKPGDNCCYSMTLNKDGKIYIKGKTCDTGGYAIVKITDKRGRVVVDTPVDFYSLAPAEGLRYISPKLAKGIYTLTVTVSDMKSNWSDKKRNIYGSKGYNVIIDEIGTLLMQIQ